MESLKVARIVATPSDLSWVQTLVTGNFYALLSVEKAVSLEEEVGGVGKRMLVKLQDELEKKAEKSLTGLKEVLSSVGEQTPEGVSLSAVVAQLSGKILYAALFGSCRAYLVRNGEIGQILKPGTNTVSASSGVVENGDIIILQTEQFTSLIDKDKILSFFKNNPFEEAAENITPLIHGRDDASASGTIIFQITGEVSAPSKPSPVSAIKSHIRIIASRLIGLADRFGSRRRKALLLISMAFFIMLAGGIFWGFQQQKKSSRETLFKDAWQKATVKFDEGKTLLSLNPELSRQPLYEARSLIEAQGNLSKNDLKKRDKLLTEINDLLNTALKRQVVSDPALFFDAEVIRQTVTPSIMSLLGKTMGLLDKKNGTVYNLSVSSKAYDALVSGLISQTLLTVGESAFFIADDRGIVKIETVSKKTTLVVESREFGKLVSLIAFSNNIYVLDKERSQIFKFVQSEEGKFTRKDYFSPNLKLDFSAGTAMAIDGAIYVLFEDGTIRKYLEGRLDNFAVSGIDSPFRNPTGIFTNKDQNFLYVLDKGNKRVVVLKKSGGYEAQYVWEGIKDVSSFAVSEADGKIFLLSGSKIYAIDLL